MLTIMMYGCAELIKQYNTIQYNAVLSYTPYVAYSQTIRRRKNNKKLKNKKRQDRQRQQNTEYRKTERLQS